MDFRMTSTSSRAAFLLAVKKAQSFLRGPVRFVATFLSDLCLAALRIVVTCVVFTTCMMVVLHYMGVPMPGPAELLDKFTDLDRLTSILS
jgi:hypothetical protein